MSQGLSAAGIKIIGALDSDPACRETYEANHPHTTFIQRDITEMHPSELESALPIRRDDDDLIFVGCSPCQYWSVITGNLESERKRKSFASRNLLSEFHRFVEYFRPGFVLIENVRGIKRNRDESGLATVVNFLETNGYKCEEDELQACLYGVPQKRRRYVLIASRVGAVKFPKADENPTVVTDLIGNLPRIEAGASPPKDDSLHRSAGLRQDNIERLKLTPEGGFREHWADTDLQIPTYRDNPDKFRENYGRMAWSEPAPTITTKFFALGSGRFGHPEQLRAISLREGALLQTFPMDYKFKTKSIAATAKLIGNAVPPELARRIGKTLIELIG